MDRDTYKKQNAEINNKQIEIYNSAAIENGISSNAVLWTNPQTQYLRFHELVKLLDLNDARRTLLDVGCGNGELYKFLNFIGYRGHYVGYDINEMLLNQARHRFQGIDVQQHNIMTEGNEQHFDYVVLSGLFNVNVGQDIDWVYSFLKKIYAISKNALIFNMISTHVTFRDDGMFYVDPAQMLSFCIDHLSKRTTLMHHNLPYNYTVAVFRDESWEAICEAELNG